MTGRRGRVSFLRRRAVAQSTFSLRSSHRVPIACPVVFGGAPFVGEGSLNNLSFTGCSITGDRTVLAGSYIRLAVLLPGLHTSLFVDLGKVQWVSGHVFGVEFIRMPMLAQQPLDHAAWGELASRLGQPGPDLR